MAFPVLILVCLLALPVGLSYGLYRYVFYSPVGEQNNDYHLAQTDQTLPLHDTITSMIDAMRALPYEEVEVLSRDGLRLHGRLFLQREGAPLHLCFHGYRGTPFRDFSGGARSYLSLGHNVLLAEQRGHLNSEGHTITFGLQERYDVLSWTDYALDRFGKDTPLVLTGISMGAATVLMASALPLPKSLAGIVADCPYTSPEAILKKVSRDLHYPTALAYPLLKLSARLFGHFSLEGVSAAEAITHSPVPILLLHGEDDRFVPFSMSREIQAACPERVTLVSFPGAGHGLSFLADQPRYEREVREFLSRVLPGEHC